MNTKIEEIEYRELRASDGQSFMVVRRDILESLCRHGICSFDMIYENYYVNWHITTLEALGMIIRYIAWDNLGLTTE